MMWYGWKTPWQWPVLSSWAFQLNKDFVLTRKLWSWSSHPDLKFSPDSLREIHKHPSPQSGGSPADSFPRIRSVDLPVERSLSACQLEVHEEASDAWGVRCFVGQPFCSCHTAMSCFLLVSFFIEASWFATTRHFGSVQQFFLALCPCWPRRA